MVLSIYHKQHANTHVCVCIQEKRIGRPSGSDTTLSISPLQRLETFSRWLQKTRTTSLLLLFPPVWMWHPLKSWYSLLLLCIYLVLLRLLESWFFCFFSLLLLLRGFKSSLQHSMLQPDDTLCRTERGTGGKKRHWPFARYHPLLYTEHVHLMCSSSSFTEFSVASFSL